MIEFEDKFYVTGNMTSSVFRSKMPFRSQTYHLPGWDENPYTSVYHEYDVYVVLNDFGKKIFSYNIELFRSIYIKGDNEVSLHWYRDLGGYNFTSLMSLGIPGRFHFVNSVDEIQNGILIIDIEKDGTRILFPVEIIPLDTKSKAKMKMIS